MNLWSRIHSWTRAVLRRSRLERDMETELRFHIEARAEDLIRSGMPRPEALRRACIEFGGVEQTKEACRSSRGLNLIDDLRQDLPFAVRTLTKAPAFTAIAVLTLALGIGANTAIFAVVYGVLLRPLPYPEPDRIVQLAETSERGTDEMDVTATELQRLRDFGQLFDSIAGYTDLGINIAAGSAAEHVRGMPVSADYFNLLGVHPALGREFLPKEDQGEGQRVVILSHALWNRRFGSDPAVIGRRILLNGESYTVIGVMPGNFDERANSDINPGLRVDVWVPLALVAKTAGSGENIPVIARLKHSVTKQQLSSQMDLVTEAFRKEFPQDTAPEKSLTFLPYQFMMGADVRLFLFVLLGAIGFVLLIACANVANLLLARGSFRAREIAVRTALGATRGRLSRQLLTESMLIAFAGGALGWAVASAGLQSVLSIAPFDLPRLNDIHLDGSVFGFTFLISILTGALFGIVPALHVTKTNLSHSLKEGEGRASAATGRSILRRSLIIGEFAMSLVLLTGAGLLIATFARLMNTNPGFDPHPVLAMRLWLVGSNYHSTAEIANFYRTVERRISSLPGVQAVGIVAAGLPLERGGNSSVKIVEAKQSDWLPCKYREASPNYFRAMGITLLSGREILETDTESSNRVVVVSESFAKRYFAGRNSLGEHIYTGGVFREVIGVVADVRSFLEKPADPTAFIPAAQVSYEGSKVWEGWFPRNIVVRASGDPLVLSKAVRETVASIDPLVPTGAILTMDQMMSSSQALRRFMMLLLSIFGGLALVLATVGLYGVISFAVSQRTREIGVRVALGARPGDVLRMILTEGLKLVLVGAVLGLASALALTRVLQEMVYGVSTRDPLTFTLVSLLLAAVSLAACYIPARRALRVDPSVALRYE
jgi:putative ABC transport system permease protein